MADASGYETHAFVAEFYDQLPGHRDRPDVAFYLEAAREARGPVLEIGCGTGRVLIPIARERIPITGLDLSAYMLAKCRERLSSEPEEVRSCVKLVQEDMRNFRLDTTFNLVTTPFRPFQHLTTVEDQCSCLRAIHVHLNSRGRLILDIFNPWLAAIVGAPVGEEVGPEGEFSTADGRKVVRWHKFVSKDLFNQTNYMEIIYYVTHPDGRTERLVHSYAMRYLFRFEAEHLLARCGFSLLNVYADFQKNAYGSTYPGELIMVAEKA